MTPINTYSIQVQGITPFCTQMDWRTRSYFSNVTLKKLSFLINPTPSWLVAKHLRMYAGLYGAKKNLLCLLTNSLVLVNVTWLCENTINTKNSLLWYQLTRCCHTHYWKEAQWFVDKVETHSMTKYRRRSQHFDVRADQTELVILEFTSHNVTIKTNMALFLHAQTSFKTLKILWTHSTINKNIKTILVLIW